MNANPSDSPAVLRGSVFVPPTAILVAEHLALLQRAGIDLQVTRTTSSHQQREQLIAGTHDFVVTAMDNVIVWNREGADLRIVAQIEQTTPLSLFARAAVASIDDLAGATLGVDAFDNGFAVVLRHLVHSRGLRDVNYVETGGVQERFDALSAGGIDAALLGPPFDERAMDQGLSLLGRVDGLFPAFPGQGIVINRARLDEFRMPLTRLLGVLGAAISWSDSVEASTGHEILEEAGFGAVSAASAWLNRPRDLWPLLPGLALLLDMRRGLQILPEGIEVDDLWSGELLAASEGASRG